MMMWKRTCRLTPMTWSLGPTVPIYAGHLMECLIFRPMITAASVMEWGMHWRETTFARSPIRSSKFAVNVRCILAPVMTTGTSIATSDGLRCGSYDMRKRHFTKCRKHSGRPLLGTLRATIAISRRQALPIYRLRVATKSG